MTNYNSTNDVARENAIQQAEMNNKLNVVSARAEALSIVVNILNSILEITQSSSSPIAPEILANIQNAINKENNITTQLFAQVSKYLGEPSLEEPSIPSAPSEVIEPDSSHTPAEEIESSSESTI